MGEQEVVSNCLAMRRTTERVSEAWQRGIGARPPGQNGPYKPFIVIDRQIDNKGPAAGSGGHSPHPAAAAATATARVTRKRKV